MRVCVCVCQKEKPKAMCLLILLQIMSGKSFVCKKGMSTNNNVLQKLHIREKCRVVMKCIIYLLAYIIPTHALILY